MVVGALTAVEAVSTEAAVACAEVDPAWHPRRVQAGDIPAECAVALLHLGPDPIGQMQDPVATVIVPTPVRRLETGVGQVLRRRLAQRRTANGIHLEAGLAM